MSEIDINIIKQEILSLLVSAKNGLSEHELLNDYRMFNSNKDLPYRELGYSSLISLLRSWPDICRVQQQGGNNGAMKILAVEEESTKHILSMVKGQRQSKSSRRRTRRGGNRTRGGGGAAGDGRNNGRDNRGGGGSGRFAQGSFNSSRGRPGNNSRGASNGRAAYNNNNRFDRSIPSSRATAGSSNQNSRYRSNAPIAPRFVKHQQQIRSYLTGSHPAQPSSYDSRQTTNPMFVDDRRVINNSISLKVTVNNSNNNAHEYNNYDYQSSPDTPYHLSEYESNENEEQYDEGDDDREDEVINNLQTLLTEYPHGIRLLALDNLYQKKFGKSLLIELKLANILLLQDYVDDFATISRHGEENGSCDHIITLKDPKQVAQTQAQLLQQITDSGIVPKTFRYANNLFSYINDRRFQGFISDIDKTEHCIHIQPVRYQEHIETLMEELDSYYSSPMSNQLTIDNIQTGLTCVTKYDGVYHRAFIKESDLYRCVVVYVDYGTTEEINKNEQQFKYLLKHFAELPCMAIACRLDDVCFIPDDNQWLPDTYNEVYALCQHGPFFIEPTGYMNGLLTIKILDADERSLNDIVIESKLAVRISVPQNNSSIDKPGQQNRSKPVALTFDFMANAVQCPLPDSAPTSPDRNTTNSNFKLPENHSSNIEPHYKFIQIDENNSFYLIRYNNKPYIPCFNLARLLQVSESDILSEALIPRIHYNQTQENRSVFDFLKQSNLTDCLHINNHFLIIFDLTAIIKLIEQLDQTNLNNRILMETFREQINSSNQPQYWIDTYNDHKRSDSVPPVLSVQSSNQTDVERYNELLARRRNILCNILRTNDVNECTHELESIENELQQLVEKMRLGATSQQNSNVSLTPPPGFTTSTNNNQQTSTLYKNDKLRDLMQRCKKLINTILVLDDYVPIDDNIITYIQGNLPFLNSNKSSIHDMELHKHYSELLENLTHIVNDLHKKLPNGTIL